MISERDKKIRRLCQKLEIVVPYNKSITVLVLKSICKKLKKNSDRFKNYNRKKKEELYNLILNTPISELSNKDLSTQNSNGPGAAPMSPMLRLIKQRQNPKKTVNNGQGAAPMSPMLRLIKQRQKPKKTVNNRNK